MHHIDSWIIVGGSNVDTDGIEMANVISTGRAAAFPRNTRLAPKGLISQFRAVC